MWIERAEGEGLLQQVSQIVYPCMFCGKIVDLKQHIRSPMFLYTMYSSYTSDRGP